jgi:putative nucleotidyltransferase with HDIG domain
MYIDKLTNRKFENKHIIDNIIETLHSRSAAEKQHSETVGELCAEIGAALGLPENEISKLRRAGYLHDIGKIIMDESSLVKDVLSEHEKEKVRQHPAVGFRILNLFDDTLDLAEYVYGHHEKRDGSGYPRGLAGEQIPLGSRIISVVEICERMLRRGDLPPEERQRRAIEEIREGAGTRYDPKIAELFVRIIERKDGEASQNPSS